jgi:hypothetical protein
MERAKARTYRGIFRSLMMALGVATIIGGISSRPALADDGWHHRGWRGDEWREHEWREREGRWHYPQAFVYPGYPGYTYYAPPPVIYAPPPPVYYAPAPPPIYYRPQASVDFLFRFH